MTKKDAREIQIDMQSIDISPKGNTENQKFDALEISDAQVGNFGKNEVNQNDITNIIEDTGSINEKDKPNTVNGNRVEGPQLEEKKEQENQNPNKYLTLDETVWETIVNT